MKTPSINRSVRNRGTQYPLNNAYKKIFNFLVNTRNNNKTASASRNGYVGMQPAAEKSGNKFHTKNQDENVVTPGKFTLTKNNNRNIMKFVPNNKNSFRYPTKYKMANGRMEQSIGKINWGDWTVVSNTKESWINYPSIDNSARGRPRRRLL